MSLVYFMVSGKGGARATLVRVLISIAAGAVCAVLEGGEAARSQTLAAPDKAAHPTASKPPPIPEAGPLAHPKSLEQVGLPPALIRRAVPPVNLQTPEKIALG